MDNIARLQKMQAKLREDCEAIDALQEKAKTYRSIAGMLRENKPVTRLVLGVFHDDTSDDDYPSINKVCMEPRDVPPELTSMVLSVLEQSAMRCEVEASDIEKGYDFSRLKQ